MSGLLFLIPIAVSLGLVALWAFLWALRTGQYEDVQGAGERILTNDDAPLTQLATNRSGPQSAAVVGKAEVAPPAVAAARRSRG